MKTEGEQLARGRKAQHLTQAQAAGRLGVSQAYLSMAEKGRRKLSLELMGRAAELYHDPLMIPAQEHVELSLDDLASELGALGYSGFAYLAKGGARRNPATVLLSALCHPGLEARLMEALPWLLLQYPGMEHDWLLRHARERNLTNRLGFVVSLARGALARVRANDPRQERLAALEQKLDESRLAKEETFGGAFFNPVEQEWLRSHRSREAAHWNLLNDFGPEDLRYVA